MIIKCTVKSTNNGLGAEFSSRVYALYVYGPLCIRIQSLILPTKKEEKENTNTFREHIAGYSLRSILKLLCLL